MSKENTRLSTLRLSAFVSPEAPLSAFLMVVVVFVPPFYTGSMGLGLGLVGMIFGLTKLWDVVTDPAFGLFSDRWYTRWGRRRPWLVASVPLMIIGSYMVFVPTAPVTASYFAFWMIMLYVGWTLASISHISWAAELSSDYHERSRISAFKQGAALLGSFSLMLMVALADHIPGFDEADRLAMIATAIIISLPLTVLAALWATPEPQRVVITKKTEPKPMRLLLSNGPLRRLLATNIFLGMATGAVAGMFLFFVEKVLKLGNWSSFALLPWLFSGLLFLPLFVALSRRIGKHRALCVAIIYQTVASTLFLVLPAGDIVFACLAFLLLGANQAVGTYIPRAIMADVTDFDAVKSGEKRTGLYMSLLQTSSKIAAALAVGLSYPMLNMIGFDAAPNGVNSEETLNHLRWLMVLIPGSMYVLVVLTMWRFPLGEEQQIMLRQQLEIRGNEMQVEASSP